MIRKLSLSSVIAFLILFQFIPEGLTQEREAVSPSEIVKEIGLTLDKAYDSYAAGNPRRAKLYASQAYFDVFEGKGMEQAVAVRSASRKVELESLFGRVMGEIDKDVDPFKLRATIDELMKELQSTAKVLEEEKTTSTNFTLFINSLFIIVREGFEAILIISALTAYLVKIGRPEKVKTVYQGGAIAILASLVVAYLFQAFFSTALATREALEGITMLLATGVLFYVSYWLISKSQIIRWQRYIRSKVEASLTRGNIYALGFAAFLAVFREGVETVLFYQALYSSGGDGPGYLMGGFGTGLLILVALFLVMRYGTVRIPIGPFFAVTSTLLYYLAFTFAGKGILELQVANWVSTTPIEGFPAIGFLGIYPSWEGLSIQILLIFAILVAIAYSLIWKPYRERAVVTRDISHIESDMKTIHEVLDDVSQHAMICHGLTSGATGQEVDEIRRHLVDIDKKVHEVAGHITKLEKGLEDIFLELEREIKYRGQRSGTRG